MTLLRDANYLIETLPQYQSSFPEPIYNHYLGEAYFVRAMVFNAMARRFGGVPLVTKVLHYPAELSTLEVPRSSEEDTWNQVLADFDQAVELLSLTSPKKGYAKDRKSTRLNSSHVKISYAVFCLKKKKKERK